jgi:hypothetical protein
MAIYPTIAAQKTENAWNAKVFRSIAAIDRRLAKRLYCPADDQSNIKIARKNHHEPDSEIIAAHSIRILSREQHAKAHHQNFYIHPE